MYPWLHLGSSHDLVWQVVEQTRTWLFRWQFDGPFDEKTIMEVQKGNIITTDLKETERVRLTESVVGWVIQFYSNITGGGYTSS